MQIHPGWVIPLILFAGGMTFLFPLLSVFLQLLIGNKSLQSKKEGSDFSTKISIDVLIPAYNEEDVIAITLESVQNAIKNLLKINPNIKCRIIVNLDGPKDRTPELVRNFSDVIVLDRGENRGKWTTLEELVQNSNAQWCVMVDCGTVWPEDFLSKLINAISSCDAVGFGPGYFLKNSGVLEKIVWWQERMLKKIENLAGGPIALHGATMIFRRDVLSQCFKELHGLSWLNDDVVLGISMRKYGNIKYLSGMLDVSDCGFKKDAKEFNRRKRMLLGNIEWIKKLFPSLLLKNPVVATLALRRIFRVFWVYNIIGTTFSLAMLVGFSMSFSLTIMLIPAVFLLLHPRLREALRAGLAGPLLIFKKSKTVFWS